ncbi:MAG: hypothetical protein KDI82_08850 [Gammaproteobacteria bacterium]|nr:hypothetical protein [Gammaproteobacteria bacterium]
MEGKKKNGRYEIVFSGSGAEGERRIEIMSNVMRVLKLDEQRAINLFERDDERVIYRTDDRDRAERLVSRLRHAGARSALRDSHTLAPPDWKSWELMDKPDVDYHAFHCHACNYGMRLPLSEPLPAVCPECGVVAAKFHAVDQKKRKREQMRRKVMDIRKAREEKAEAEAEIAEEARLRKEIERELRRELQYQLGFGNRLRNGLAAGLIFAVGAGSAVLMLQDPEGLPQELAAADNRATGNALPVIAPASAQQVTLHMANDLLRKLAVPTSGLDADSTATVVADAEPWLTLPPTAAGPAVVDSAVRPSARSRPAMTGLLPYQVGDAELALMITHWQNHASAAPLTRLRLERMTTQLLKADHVRAAARTALLAGTPAARLKLLLPVIGQIARENEPRRQAQVSSEVRELFADEAQDDLALAQWLLEQAPLTPGFDQLRPQALPATISAQLSRLPLVERIALYAQMAAHLAENAAPAAAQTWFDAGNTLLRSLTDPRVELVALTHLARAYHRANDQRTANELLLRIGAAIPALPGRPDARLLGQVMETYATTGKVDDAVATIEGMGDSQLEALLTQADLAVRLASAGHGIAARALVAEIDDPAVRARALAWLSAAARERGRMQAAAGLAVQAHDAVAGLRRELVALVESELAGQADGKVSAATLLTGGDDYHAQLAMNLAWQQAFGAARDSAMAVNSNPRRERLMRDLDTLQSAFANLPPGPQHAALPQSSAG